LISCKNTTGPDNEITTISITVSNECGIEVDIYMDNVFQFSVEYQASRDITNISLGEHTFEAKNKGTDTVLSNLSVEITEVTQFTWTILSEANFHVTNEYGESLDIYGDGDLLSEIVHSATLVVENVLYGQHFFEAKKVSDDTLAASITIDFVENKNYFWTISK
jgi:hypothetical protein